MNIAAELNISLEPHLLDALTPIPPLIPASLASKLIPYLSEPRLPTIPYLILQSISQWSRTPSGLSSLQSHSPPLDPQSYTMIALLAGTTTSPERRFAEYVRKKEPEELEVERKRERKAITALLNALLSIGGSAAATWWAAEKTGWKNEWVRVALPFTSLLAQCNADTIIHRGSWHRYLWPLWWQPLKPSFTPSGNPAAQPPNPSSEGVAKSRLPNKRKMMEIRVEVKQSTRLCFLPRGRNALKGCVNGCW